MEAFSKWHKALSYLKRESALLKSLCEVLRFQRSALAAVDLIQLEDGQLRLEMLLAEAENNTFKRVKWQRKTFGAQSTPTWRALLLKVPDELRVEFEEGINELQTLGQSVRILTEANHRAAQRAGDLLRHLRQVSHRSTQTANQLYTSNGKIGHSINYQAAMGGVS